MGEISLRIPAGYSLGVLHPGASLWLGTPKTNGEEKVEREGGINSNKWLFISTLFHIPRRLLCFLPGVPVAPDALFCFGTEATPEPVQHVTIPSQQFVTYFCLKSHTHTRAVKNSAFPSQIGTVTHV